MHSPHIAALFCGGPPRSVHLKLDPDVFDYFKSLGKGHITKMQEVLRAYANAHRR
ncbi:MAG TPA: BrnA antitoxin family protein [Reyranella sp.]|nr:BrnA antitoxin family protein [Reyranella sp.]